MDDEDDVFEVERILYQRDFDGETKYLVKWVGYPEEECTWEPEYSFNGDIVFTDWQKQWQNGDILDDIDLQRVQDQMRAFQKRQDTVALGSEVESEAEYETISDLNRPAKKQKLVHDAPPLRKKKSHKEIFSPQMGNVKPSSRLPPVRQPHSQFRKVAAPPLHRPQILPSQAKPNPVNNGTSTTGSTSNSVRLPVPAKTGSSHLATPLPVSHPLPQKPDIPGSTTQLTVSEHAPPAFYAPELNERARRPKLTDTTTASRGTAGKHFRNLQHLNNAQKRVRENRQAPLPSSIVDLGTSSTQSPDVTGLFLSNSGDYETSVTESAPPVREDQPESVENDSHLFFSDSEGEDSKSEVQNQINASLSAKVDNTPVELKATFPNTEHQSAGMSTDLVTMSMGDVEINKQMEREAPIQVLVSGQTPRPTSDLEEGAKDVTSRPFTHPMAEQMTGITTSPMKHVVEPAIGEMSEPGQAQRPRRNSLFNQRLPADLRLSTATPAGVSAETPVSTTKYARPAAETHRTSTVPPIELRGRGLLLNQPMKSMRDDHVQREFHRHDAVVHVSGTGSRVFAAKMIHIDWECRLTLLKAKQNSKRIWLDFSENITRPEYDNRSGLKWYNYFDIGVIEPFPDTSHEYNMYASHLEQTDQAALWYHPSPDTDIMLIMYSVRSTSWQDFGSKPARDYPSRLSVAFRTKLPKPDLESLASRLKLGNERESVTSALLDETRKTDRAHRDDRRYQNRSRQSSAASEDRFLGKSIINESTVILANPPSDLVRTSHAPTTATPNTLPSGQTISMDTAMEIDEPVREASLVRSADIASSTIPSNVTESSVIRSPQRVHRSIPFDASGRPVLRLDRTIKELGYAPKLKVVKSKTSILLAYTKTDESRVQQIKDWIIHQGLPWDQIYRTADKTGAPEFLKTRPESVCVILFDMRYPLAKFPQLGNRIAEGEDLVCWQMDYDGDVSQPLVTKKIFSRGIAMTISESCFLTESGSVQQTLKWFKHYAKQPYPAAMIMIPPNIIQVLVKEANIASALSVKALLIDLAVLVEELSILANTPEDESPTPDEPDCMQFRLVAPDWESVYKDLATERSQSVLEQKQEDESKEARLFSWFSAWALQNVEHYRKFYALRVNSRKIADSEHLKFENIRAFTSRLPLEKNRDRDPSKSRGREDATVRAGGTRSRSHSRGRASLTPAQSPAFGL